MGKDHALSDLFGADVERFDDEQYYRIADRLIRHKDVIEEVLERKEKRPLPAITDDPSL